MPLNYAGTSDAARFPDGLGAHAQGNAQGNAKAYVHLDAPPAHAPADAIIVPDAHILFNGDYKRSGTDLILSADGQELLLHDYFKGDKRAPLASPDGAHLTGDLVTALTGSVEVSQAGGTAAAGKVIGHVTKLQGTATAVRNGVSILLHMGDDVEKGDVVQSGSDSTLGITFVDGTVFGLSSNARMVLNEMVYDPNGSNNSSLISLVAGTISFVAGETAKHGDMKVDTPVATMGIRGTAVLVEIDFSVPGQGGTPGAKFQVLVEPNGTTGSYVLLDKATLQPLATVNQAGQQINISNGVISQTSESLSPEIQKLIQDVFSLKFTDNTDPKSNSHFTDVGVPKTEPLHFANDANLFPTYVVGVQPGDSSPTQFSINQVLWSRLPEPPKAVVLDISSVPQTAFGLTEKLGRTGDTSDPDAIVGKVNYADPNDGDQPTVSVSFRSFTYQDAQHHDVSGSLNALQLQHVAATEVGIVVLQDPAHRNVGTANWSYSVADKAFDFLAEGETLTLTYIVHVDNNFAQGSQAIDIPITITVTGTNDTPVITTGAQTIALTDDTRAPGGPLPPHDPTGGTLSFADADLSDTHTVSSSLSGAVLQGGGAVPSHALTLFAQAFNAGLAADSTGTGHGTIDWSLADLPADLSEFIAPGQTLTLTYTVTVADSHGATSEQIVTVTITGAENPAQIWIGTGTAATRADGARIASLAAPVLLWSDGANWKTGHAPTDQDDVIIITDQSQGLTPAFPVTIDRTAFAKSVTMDDLGGGNTPELDNLGTLTISGAFTVRSDAIVHNAGTINVGGQAGFVDQGVLDNSGTLQLIGGGDFGAMASIANTGFIQLVGGTLNVSADVANADGCHHGLIQVDAGAKLVLAAGGIEGGCVSVTGALELDGGAFLSHGLLANFGTITVTGGANSFDGENISANHALEIMTDSALALNCGTIVDNHCGSITVDDGATLSLDHARISGGVLQNFGEIDIIGGGIGALAGGTVETVAHLAAGGGGATLADVAVANAGTIDVDAGAVLRLEYSTITGGGTVHVIGEIDSIGCSSIGGTVINDGLIEVKSGTLEIDGPVTGCGAITIDVGATLELGGADAQMVRFDGYGSSELVLDTTGSVKEVQGFGISDELDLRAIHFDGDPTATYDRMSHVLTVSDSDGDVVRVKLAGDDYSHAHFAASDDGHGGTLITLEACDAAPVIAACDQHQSGAINERTDTTGSFRTDSAGGTIHFTDVDLTDRPTARISEQCVTWTDANGCTLSLTPYQEAALEHALKLSQSGNTNNGAVDWTYAVADRDLDFLGAGQTLTITSMVTIDDHQGGRTSVPVTVTINGAEDAPVIVGETDPAVQTVILSKSPIVLAAGTTMNTAGLSTETFDGHEAGSAANNGHGHGDFYSTSLHAWFDAGGNAGVVHGSSSASAAPYVGQGSQDKTNYLSIGAHADETITFDHQQNSFGLYWGSVDSFNSIGFYNGDKLVASYDGDDIAPLLANGGQGSFASNGYVEFLDLAPFTKVVLNSGQNAFELDNISSGHLNDSRVKLASPIAGTLTVADKDVGDTLTASVMGDAAVKYNGSSHLPPGIDVDALIDSSAIKFDSVSSDGGTDVLHWTYDPTGANLDFLEPGDTLTVTYQAEVSDGHGSFGLQPLTITINGNGSSVVNGTAQNDTFDNVGGGVTIFGKGGSDSFMFNPHFGSATIADFDVSRDALVLDHSLFGPTARDVLGSAHASGHDTILIDAAHDTITLKGVTIAQLTAHQNDFHIV
jgi:VCBS repeat-containing protein